MPYEITLFFVVSFFLFGGVMWPTFWLTKYRIKKKEIHKRKDFVILKDEARRQERILYRNLVTNKLAGFKVVTWITVWITTATFLLTSINYLHAVQLEIQDRRPWISIAPSQIAITEVGEKKKSGEPLLVTTYIENIGKTPAKYISGIVLKNSYSEISLSEEEPITGILFPGEKRRIGWLARWNNDDESLLKWAREVRGPEILCVLCGVEIKVDYTPINSQGTKYFTLSELEWSQPKEGYVGKVEQSFKTLDAK
ncbi:MAG: hypothetical protein WC735_04860 [Candidatus Paceibacterota bacterium]|jgi:hypothetical protein